MSQSTELSLFYAGNDPESLKAIARMQEGRADNLRNLLHAILAKVGPVELPASAVEAGSGGYSVTRGEVSGTYVFKASEPDQPWHSGDAERHSRMRELAKRYHSESEAYDRTVCTGPVVDGAVVPVGPEELRKVNAHAIKLMASIVEQGRADGITRSEMLRAIASCA